MKPHPQDYVWVHLECPLCQRPFSLSKLITHRNIHHAELSVRALERAIADALKAKVLTYKVHALGPPQRMASPTTLLRERAGYLKVRGGKTLEGGAWGLKGK